MTTAHDPLPPLADVLRADANAMRSRLSKPTLGKPFVAAAADVLDIAARTAAPYDAELARLRARIAELESELAPFRALAREALALDTPRDPKSRKVSLPKFSDDARLIQRLAAMHKEAADG